MVMRILAFNVGSSSIKYSFFIGNKKIDCGCYERLKERSDYEIAVEKILKKFSDEKINLIIHRIVHGGQINKPSRINEKIKEQIKKFSEFAPLHNPKELMTIELIEKKTKIPQYAVFDTMFFSEIPEAARNYALPSEIVKKYKIRKYGFHGLSHKFVSRGLKGKTITCHLGSGSSISAILDGKPLDTSMGMTPLEGVMMGTRSGSIDPGIIFFLQKNGYNVEDILTNKSGLKGISGYSDFRDVLKNINKNKNCKLAYELFIYRIIKVIGSYIPVLNGLDNLVFTGAIGENNSKIRKDICKKFEFLGMNLDDKKNNSNAEKISSHSSKVNVFVKKTDEEKQMIEEVLKLK